MKWLTNFDSKVKIFKPLWWFYRKIEKIPVYLRILPLSWEEMEQLKKSRKKVYIKLGDNNFNRHLDGYVEVFENDE